MFATSAVLWSMDCGHLVAGSAPFDQFDTGVEDDLLEVNAWVPFGVIGALVGFVVALRLTRPIRPALPRPPAIP
ncbi:MAG: hypothetical protein H6835_16950 [Planctomycetes bacterium]|nr:hypothetical protein [Planctomycetota bacterium]